VGVDRSHIECRRCGRRVSVHAPRCPECCADPHDGASSFRESDRDRLRVCEGVGIRALALLLDFLILSGVFLLVALAVFLLLVADARFAEVGKEPAPDPLWAAFSGAAFVYFWLFEARGGTTLGKRLLGLRVVDTSGRRIGYSKAFVRTALRVVDFLPFACVAGAVTIAVTRRHQRLGDLAAGTVVVRPHTLRLSEARAASVPTVPWVGPEAAGPARREG